MAFRSVAAAMLPAATACMSSPRISTDFDRPADFSRCRTDSWALAAAPIGMNPLVYERLGGRTKTASWRATHAARR